ncbi:MAG: flagellar hook assembly protein FlgD [Pseudomonadales bacterium]
MDTTNSIESLIPDSLAVDTTATPPKKKEELGQNEFLKLMLAQLEHQDPFKPLENGEFVAQMAQFSTVAGIEGMEISLDSMSQSLAGNQLMQASSLIGRTAMVPSSNTTLREGSSVDGLFSLPQSSSYVSLDIYNEAGELVHNQEFGTTQAGVHPFSWNGSLKDGSSASPGLYTISVNSGQGDNTTQLGTVIENRISTVSLTPGSNAITLETEEGNLVSLLDVQQLK